MKDNNFICPECGSNEAGYQTMVSMEEPTTNNSNKDPWDSILQQIECSSCGNIIPVHIANRWDNMNIEKAKEEWNKLYKKTNHLRKFD